MKAETALDNFVLNCAGGDLEEFKRLKASKEFWRKMIDDLINANKKVHT